MAGWTRIRFAGLLLLLVQVSAGGEPEYPIEELPPIEMHTDIFHSLPIAGHMVTPDQVAERVMTNPRLRVTAGLPYSGKGTANPIHQSGVAGTHADPIRRHEVRGADRAPKP